MRNLLLLIFGVIMLTGCSTNDDQQSTEVNIRLSNVSSVDFKNISVNTSTGLVDFPPLIAGQKSDYQVFERAYGYAFIELEIDGKTFTLQPIDFVGETPLNKGRYTYRIDANDSQEQYSKLSLSLLED